MCITLVSTDIHSNNSIDIIGCPVSGLQLGLILGLRPASERRRYEVTPSLIGWAQT